MKRTQNISMSYSSKLCLFLFLVCIFIQPSLGKIVCEHLPSDVCALAISSSGMRCLLETYKNNEGKMEYECRTSEVTVTKMSDYIESDECVNACGVDRNMVGISSDNLLEPHFTTKLCSRACYNNCANIIDLYYNLAVGEGVYLPDLCKKQRSNPRRAMMDFFMSSGGAALAPTAGSQVPRSLVADAPSPSPPLFGF